MRANKITNLVIIDNIRDTIFKTIQNNIIKIFGQGHHYSTSIILFEHHEKRIPAAIRSYSNFKVLDDSFMYYQLYNDSEGFSFR